MSFIIKGFDTDRNCLHCFFQSEDTDRCLLTDDDIPLHGKGHPESCPLVPIPEGHGRLIDGTDLYAVLDGGFDVDLDDLPETKDAILSMIQSAETIVPAEGGNADG